MMSTDQAHSLGDSFDRRIGKVPVAITENLDAVEIDTVYESEKSWGNLKDYVKQLLTARGGGGIEAEELLVFPGLEELFSMFQILDVYESGVYDTIIVDCAPTGETLSLLKYPGTPVRVHKKDSADRESSNQDSRQGDREDNESSHAKGHGV